MTQNKQCFIPNHVFMQNSISHKLMSPVLTTDNFYYRLQSTIGMMVESDFIDTLTKPFSAKLC